MKFIGFLIIPIIVSGILTFLREPKEAKKGKVYLHKLLFFIGAIATTFFLVLTFIAAFTSDSVGGPIAFFVFSLLCSSLVIAYVNCRITYDDQGFVAKNFFGIKRKFTYDQVTGIRVDMHEDYIYIGKRKVMVDSFAVGGFEFISFLKKKCRKNNGGRGLTKVEKHGIFNGNVEDATGFIIVYVMFSVFIIGFAAFLVWNIFFNPSTVENTIEKQVCFNSFAVDGEKIIFGADDNVKYKIHFVDDEFDTQELRSACDGKTALTVFCEEQTPDDEPMYYSVKAILCGDKYLLSFEDTNRFYSQEYWPLLLFPVVFALIWGTFITMSIIVGRHPQKFGKKIVHMFFKPGYVKGF
jgi:hypothetical protein